MPRATLAILPFLALTSLASLGACGGGEAASPSASGEIADAPPAGGKISSASGPCLVIRGEQDRVIENADIGPCAGAGIEIWDSQNVTIRGATISDTVDAGVYVFGSSNVQILESRIAKTSAGVNAVESRGVRVSCNTIENPRGPVPKGQLVQFDKVAGGGNIVRCNAGRNQPGQGNPEDAISIYQSNGTPAQPISVLGNLIVGGGPSETGGGILLGDNGGSFQLAKGNTLVDPGQYGIAVAGGDNMSITQNVVFARRQPFTNVGMYVWRQSEPACFAISVSGNTVSWTSKDGQQNPFWDADTCGPIEGVASNNFMGKLNSDIAAAPPPVDCECQTNGWR